MPERYKNIKIGSLDEYITPYKFRTISEEMRDIPIGISEFAVEIHMKQKCKSISLSQLNILFLLQSHRLQKYLNQGNRNYTMMKFRSFYKM